MRLIREQKRTNQTFGVLFFDNFFECFTLENSHRIIPAGTYEISLYNSPRFKRIVPLLQKVPNRSMIEMHIANYYHQLEGCIGLGKQFNNEMLINSTAAFQGLMNKISMNDKLSIKIEDAPSI